MTLGITKGLTTWQSQQRTVERFTDTASYTSGHPDDTLVLAGPPRFSSVKTEGTTGTKTLLAIGMLQGFQYQSTKPTTPLQAIGSGRSFFVSGKSSTTWRVGRLFCNGRNLLRVLYHNMVAGEVPVQDFDDKPVDKSYTEMHYINLDSELYYIPFGLAALFKTKTKDFLGAVYLELSMIVSYGISFNAGQSMIMEDVSGMCDRVLPFRPAETNRPGVPRATIDEVIGFTAGSTFPNTGTGVEDTEASLDMTESER